MNAKKSLDKNKEIMAKNSCGEPEFNLDGVNCDFYTDINNDGHIISGGLLMDILSTTNQLSMKEYFARADPEA